MYAPKLKPWVTEYDRASMAIAHRVDCLVNEAKAEIAKMVEEAREAYCEPIVYYDPKSFQKNITLQDLANMQAQLGAWRPQHPLGDYLGSAFSWFRGI